MIDPTSMVAWLSTFLPDNYVALVVAAISISVTLCAVITRFWKPPATGSRWVPVYKMVTAIAQARGWGSNAYVPGQKALMIPVTTDRTEASEQLGLDPGTTHPKTR
ncbi:MAG: hypothetical protein LKH33_06895 [Acetobacter sp.]|jgi:hypothetical protein|nr:hypothetical protein [Acetobacter sp.]MCH4060506.1 hypothetical protein [Acetobacter sp.]MCH4087446.1 hypothetical protein [Acetobacter sp.]MCI1293964.1 hypothetical protein [Acetobacter sp.]MCI1320442.1 hypothetical protein [Acetobacter sp.]